MTSKNLISILIPAYNCDLYIGTCISSILSQSYKNFELLIGNDGSSDNTLKVISNFHDERIKVINFPKNFGKVFVINKLLSLATGEFIAFQDADDFSNLNRIQLQYNHLIKNPSLDICFCSYSLVGYKKHGSFLRSSDSLIREEFLNGGFLNHRSYIPTVCSTILFRKKLLKFVPTFSTFFSHRFGEDIHFISRLLRFGKAETIPYELYFYNYCRPGSSTQVFSSSNDAYRIYGYNLLFDIIKLESKGDNILIENISPYSQLLIELNSCKNVLLEKEKELLKKQKSFLSYFKCKIDKIFSVHV